MEAEWDAQIAPQAWSKRRAAGKRGWQLRNKNSRIRKAFLLRVSVVNGCLSNRWWMIYSEECFSAFQPNTLGNISDTVWASAMHLINVELSMLPNVKPHCIHLCIQWVNLQESNQGNQYVEEMLCWTNATDLQDVSSLCIPQFECLNLLQDAGMWRKKQQ